MRSFVALGSVLVALVAACNGSPVEPGAGIVSRPGGGTTNQPTGGGGGPGPSGLVVDVTVQDFLFSPGTITVKVGTTVRWTNLGPSAHAVMSDMGAWGSGTLNAPTNGSGSGMGNGMGGGTGYGMGSGMGGMGGMDGGGGMGSGDSMPGRDFPVHVQSGRYLRLPLPAPSSERLPRLHRHGDRNAVV
jgi:plastocyanin